jgi:hypothetical protein
MKMKKFFGLKMTLAALAIVSFASCSDSDSGDVIIPNSQSVELPDPLYVVNGTITNLENGSSVANVTISGVVSATAENGYYEVSGSTPFKGEIAFKAEGFYDATRTIAQSTLSKGQGTLVSNVSLAMSPFGYIPGGVDEYDESKTLVPEEMADLTNTQVAALLAKYNKLTNDTDEPVVVEFSPFDDLGLKLDYGCVVPVSKVDAEQLFIDYVARTWGNDPFVGYGIFKKTLKITVPAHAVLVDLTITPYLKESSLSFETDGEKYETPVNIKDEYQVSPTFKSLDHDHGHGHGGENSGGGEGGAA